MSTKQACDDAESSWTESGRNLLRRGWSVGKNAAIAGAAMSVAPVLVPPLLVFSVFGLALSVPFGIYYVGMAGTECIMGSLLPLGQNQDEDQVRNEDEEHVEETVGLVRDGSEITAEKGERSNEDAVIIETVELTSGEDKEKSLDVEQEGKEISSAPVLEGVEIKPIKVKSTPVTEENKKRSEKIKDEKAENIGLEGQKKVMIVDSDSGKASNEAEGENGSSSGFRSEFTSPADAKSDVESTVTTDREEQYNKKQLWEQVRSLRIIIGYKAPICKNLTDEMRALYQFTGVDLPLTARDTANVMDLNYKLHFLKSVIGVK